MRSFTEPLKELAEFETIQREMKKETGMIQIAGCVNSQKTHMMYALSDGSRKRIIAVSSEGKAKEICEEYKFLDENVYYYPPKDLLFYQADIRGKVLLKQRMGVIQAILEDEEVTVVTSFDGFMDALLPAEKIRQRVIKLSNTDTVDFEELKKKIADLGYDREVQIEGPGQFAVRGGILDVFPITEEVPIRIEFWGDEIDSIRTFDVDSQRSIENLEAIEIYPATDFPEEEGQRVSFLDYFEKEESILFLDEPARLEEKGEGVEEEYLEAQKNRLEAGMEVTDVRIPLYHTKDVIKKMNEYYCIGFSALETRVKEFKTNHLYSIHAKSVNPYNNSFEMLTRDLKRLKRNGYRVVLLSGSRTRARRLAEDLRDYNLSSYYSEDKERVVMPGEILTTFGHVAEGYEYPMLKFTVISETDIFGRGKKKRKRKIYEGQKIQSFSELKIGDYVVHENHGLGIYQGIEKMDIDKTSKDYMKISYAGGSNLYIPATQLDLIQKYADADAKKPKLNRLGTQEWTKTKTKVRGAVKEIAKDLVELYAARQKEEGFVYGPDTVWQKEFEEMFPFEETEDQIMAIDAVKQDMESRKIMDMGKQRLRFEQHLKQCKKANRLYILCRQRYLHNNIIIRLYSV